jgi:hypothetical protein
MDKLEALFARKPTSNMGLGVIYSGDTRGNGVTSSEQGFEWIPRFNQRGGGGDSILPLTTKTASSAASNIYVVVEPGTVLGAMPTIGGTALSAGTPPQLTITQSGTRYVVLNINGTPDTTTLDGQVFFHPAMSGIAVTITVETTSPTAADLISNIGDFEVLLATYVDGIKTSQNGYGPITGHVQDMLDGSGDGLLELTYAAS